MCEVDESDQLVVTMVQEKVRERSVSCRAKAAYTSFVDSALDSERRAVSSSVRVCQKNALALSSIIE